MQIFQEAEISGKFPGDLKQKVCVDITKNRQKHLGWRGGLGLQILRVRCDSS